MLKRLGAPQLIGSAAIVIGLGLVSLYSASAVRISPRECAAWLSPRPLSSGVAKTCDSGANSLFAKSSISNPNDAG